MFEDAELWVCAATTLSQFGSGAEIEVALQIICAATRHDDDGISYWRRIGRLLGDLRQSVPDSEWRN